jgi:hypothetical protein
MLSMGYILIFYQNKMVRGVLVLWFLSICITASSKIVYFKEYMKSFMFFGTSNSKKKRQPRKSAISQHITT